MAYSGGVDSHALLHALASLRESEKLTLAALHADHGLVAESRRWAAHCRAVCAELAVPLETTRLNIDAEAGGLEAAARRARYAWLAQFVEHDDLLLTAHHQDDQAITLLQALLRGAGPRGASGIPAVRRFARGWLVRPLLGVSRSALRGYAARERLSWIDDPSNEDLRFDRNYLRTTVLPLLAARWPAATRVLGRSAQLMGEAEQLLDELAAADLRACLTDAGGALLPVAPTLSLIALRGLSEARLRNVLRHWIRRAGVVAPTSARLHEVCEGLVRRAGSSGGEVTWGGVALCRYRDRLYLWRPRAVPTVALGWRVSYPLDIEPLGVRITAVPVHGAGLAPDRCGSELSVRWRRGGERCRLAGRRHHHQLKKLLQELGVPPWERRVLPLVYVGGDLAAVPGLFVCEPFAARSGEAGLDLRLEALAPR